MRVEEAWDAFEKSARAKGFTYGKQATVEQVDPAVVADARAKLEESKSNWFFNKNTFQIDAWEPVIEPNSFVKWVQTNFATDDRFIIGYSYVNCMGMDDDEAYYSVQIRNRKESVDRGTFVETKEYKPWNA